MRLGAPVRPAEEGPEAWVKAHLDAGYSAAYCPPVKTDDDIVAYAAAARKGDLVIAEVGAWGFNPISSDDDLRRRSLVGIQERLALADRIGARCCVNVAGSRGRAKGGWAGHHPLNFTQETFDMIVEAVRAILDAVKPTRTYYALETMPWMYPDSVDAYERLLRAVDRERFAAHFDPVNLVCSPQIYYANGAMIRDALRRLGPRVRSCHAKDILLGDGLTVHLDEVRPGLGRLDYATFLTELDRLDPDTPLMIEHLKTPEDYRLAAEHIRNVAKEAGVTIR